MDGKTQARLRFYVSFITWLFSPHIKKKKKNLVSQWECQKVPGDKPAVSSSCVEISHSPLTIGAYNAVLSIGLTIHFSI